MIFHRLIPAMHRSISGLTRGDVARCSAAARVPRLSGVEAVTASLLPLPDDPRFAELIAAWPEYQQRYGLAWPRSAWLRAFEGLLRPYFPRASSRDLSLTARHYAPFPLAAGHDVP